MWFVEGTCLIVISSPSLRLLSPSLFLCVPFLYSSLPLPTTRFIPSPWLLDGDVCLRHPIPPADLPVDPSIENLERGMMEEEDVHGTEESGGVRILTTKPKIELIF
ncbi:hypothetical protein HA466_0074730 [Hirschfeldia incana]|nr:hypothetical protein HA466_0074730 [Hirschfeldia incana]